MKNKYYCGKCEHIGMYTGSYTHSEKLCKRYAAILKVDGNDVEKCVPCICETLEAENAALRERLEKAVELPAKIGDTVYKVYDKCDMRYCLYNGYSGQWRCHYEGERRCAPFIATKKFYYNDIPFVNKTVFVSREAAEARLKELQGGKE